MLVPVKTVARTFPPPLLYSFRQERAVRTQLLSRNADQSISLNYHWLRYQKYAVVCFQHELDMSSDADTGVSAKLTMQLALGFDQKLALDIGIFTK